MSTAVELILSLKKSMNFKEYKSVNYAQIADEILEFWKENNIFEQSIAVREGSPSFTFYEGPPSANGTPGIHHVMARTIKDIFCRYKTLRGYQVHRKGGWDTHGLPIELQVEKELGITKDDIGKKISIEDYNKKCREAVMRFTDLWQDMTDKMGYWVDMNDPYITYKNEYIESVWYLLKKFYEKGLLYKGYTIQPYSPAAGTGLSSHELNQPGCYRDVKDTSIVAQFKVKHSKKSEFLFSPLTPDGGMEDVRFLAWTTTPWTLPGNCGLTVGEKIDYVKVKTFNPYTFEPISAILAKNLVGKYFSEKAKEISLTDYKSGDKLIPFEIVQEFKGKDLLEIRYEQLIPAVTNSTLENNAFRVIAGDFVTTEDGTGIVHTASLFGADDFRVCQQNGVPSVMVQDENGKDVPVVDRKGKFVNEVGEWLVKNVSDFSIKTHRNLEKNEFYVKNYLSEDEKQADYKTTDEIISIILKQQNLAFKVEKYEHSYPHCWRTDKPVLYYPLDSWFIRTTAMKDKLAELNKTINWQPASTGTGRFGNWLENLVDWNLSRSRYWGTPLPIWRSEDGEEVCIGSVEELSNAIELSIKLGFMKENPLKPHPKSISDGEGLSDRDGLSDSQSFSITDANDVQKYVFTWDAKKWDSLKSFGRENRKNQTEAEKIIWDEVRNRKLGFKFRRQHSIGNFVADFVCIEAKLVVEIDGEYHGNQKEYDLAREDYLQDFGFSILRFSNDEIFDELETTKKQIIQTCQEKVDIRTKRGDFEEKNNEALPPLHRRGEGGEGNFDLHRPFVDNIILVSPSGKPMYRESDLIDVWFDSGAMPYAQWHYPFTPLSSGEGQGVRSFPADFISEGVDQTRGWFFTLHTIAGMLFDSVAFKNVVSTGLVLDKNGNKMSKRLGNAVDPFETLSKYGADPTRWYMITNAEPWDNLKFNLDGIGEVQRKFFGTLTNTYNFFALYANLDNYRVEQFDRIPKEKLTELDRWIVSKVYTLVKEVSAEYDNYNPTKAGRLVQDFVCDDLSNWYVRLNRRRFWSQSNSENSPPSEGLGEAKRGAYQTLQHCLCAVAQLMSPIAPFYADWLYRNLTDHVRAESIERNTPFKHQSVHFSDFHTYEPYFVDTDLEESMTLAQNVCSLVHALRKKNSLKVRQPLSKILIPVLSEKTRHQIEHISDIILSEVNVKSIEFLHDDSEILKKKVKPNFKTLGPKYGKDMKLVADAIQNLTTDQIRILESEKQFIIHHSSFIINLEDVEILTEDIPGWLVASEKGITVALDITVTDELKQEGIARDFINRIQNYRKDTGFEVTDKIRIQLFNNNQELAAAIDTHREYISQEVQALSLRIFDEKPTDCVEIEMDEYLLVVSVDVVK